MKRKIGELTLNELADLTRACDSCVFEGSLYCQTIPCSINKTYLGDEIEIPDEKT